ncbi:MAG: GDSL-type esterase/lipase family protein [Pirellulaceae bacterium]|nr:GDSL-type esterase/lipase family protein [Pirellulaceae bacterium]
MTSRQLSLLLTLLTLAHLPHQGWSQIAQEEARPAKKQARSQRDTKHSETTQPNPVRDPQFAQYGIYEQTSPRAKSAPPTNTVLPIVFQTGDRIMLIGNTLFDRAQHFGHLEAAFQQQFPQHQLVVRNLAWSADESNLQPRPANFADLDQHLTHEKADIILVAYGFNESFAGPDGLEAFRHTLASFLTGLRSKAFNGISAAKVILVSPIANENIKHVPAADLNNENIRQYTAAMEQVARDQGIGFVNLFEPTLSVMADPRRDLTINGIHLSHEGYQLFATILHSAITGHPAPKTTAALRAAIVDKNKQFFRRYRPINTFYYTGGRNKSYGYLDFLPAMKNFDLMVSNRDQLIWKLAEDKNPANLPDDSKLPPLPATKESRGANRWISAAAEQQEFTVDPRFEVNLFASEEEFPDIAAPIQMRWDNQGRLWVSCSTTYPHVYPGNNENDKLVILEDTDGDGQADKSTVFADDLHIPLSFEFGDGGVYVSEMPHLTFIKDTDGDGKADFRRRVLTGFGTEDSHHALHDVAWTPDGDLIFREAVFHHSQIETPYGPVRQQNSGWFRFQPRNHRLQSFGTYSSTNPWGVTFDDWGQHVASHPIYASAFHATDPTYPQQHPRPTGLQAYSGTCGQEFIDFQTFPEELQGDFIKVRYKPTNRVELHHWHEKEFGFEEEYVGDIIFSSNLSFIPVDIRFGPRGALYICDWYNPVKGHAQYSLRDKRRDRHSGRIWRVKTKDKPLVDPPRIAGEEIRSLLEILKRPEYRYRYWAKRELRDRDPLQVATALKSWTAQLDSQDKRFRHHQLESLWLFRGINLVNPALLRELLSCNEHHARAAATRQLRYWHQALPDSISLLGAAANDPRGIVRMEAAIAASYIGSAEALGAVMDVLKHPHDQHLTYAIRTAFGSHALRQHWQDAPNSSIASFLKHAKQGSNLKEPTPSASEAEFDRQPNLKRVEVSCLPERMKYTVERFVVETNQPVKLVFLNPDANDHNLVIVKPGALEEVGMAANEMARDPQNANSNFIPSSKQGLILKASPMIGPGRQSRVHVLRFTAPNQPGVYPYVCTFPGHWVVMKGEIIVTDDIKNVNSILASRQQATFVKDWTLDDFPTVEIPTTQATVMRGMAAFIKARCNQCHLVAGHGIELGPELTKVSERFKGQKLLRQILEPSQEIHEKYRTYVIEQEDGRLLTGMIQKEDEEQINLVTNLLNPTAVTLIPKRKIADRSASKISSMPADLLNGLTRNEILDLLTYLEAGGYQLPHHLKHNH